MFSDFDDDAQGPVLSGLFSSDGKVICTGSDDGTVFVWNPKTGKAIHHFKGDKFHEGPVTTLAHHPQQPWLLSGSADGQAFLMHTETGKVVTSFKGHKDSIEAVGFSAQHPYCATGSMDNTVIVWDLNKKSQRFKLKHDVHQTVASCSWFSEFYLPILLFTIYFSFFFLS